MNDKSIIRKVIFNKITALFLIIILAVFLITQFIKGQGIINETERIALDDFNNRIMPYIEEVDYDNEKSDSDQDANYLIYALEYTFGETGKAEISTEEARMLIKDIFDYDFNTDKYEQGVIAPRLMNKYVHFNQEKAVYVYDRSFIDKKLTSVTPIYKYVEKNAHKSGSKYVVTYEKYRIKSPYDILDCAAKNDTPIENFDKYINGEASSVSLKRATTNDCLKEIGEKTKEVTITYTAKNGHLTVTSIK
jgi:hypothetical protein